MIDNVLFDMVHEECPKFNPLLAEGFAVSQLKHNEKYIDRLFQQIARDFPSNIKYLGPMSISPLGEFRLISKFKRSNRVAYDLSKSSTYLKLYRFSIDGEEIQPVPLYQIFVGDGAMLHIRNALYNISPIIADVALSVKGDSIYIKMTRQALTFRKFSGYHLANGEMVCTYVVWSQIYNTTTRRTLGTLPHYLFCKFGLHGAFQRLGVDVIVIPRSMVDVSVYDPDNWVVCTVSPSRGSRAKTRTNAAINKVQCDVALIVPKRIWDEQHTVRSMVAGFFYVAEFAPTRITAQDYDDPRLWRLLLGKMILPAGDSDGKILNQMNTHITSVSCFVDGMVRENLRDAGYDIRDTFELFDLVNRKYPELVAQNTENSASMYGKRLVVNSYVNADIIKATTNLLFGVQKLHNAKGGVRRTDFEKIIKSNLKYDLIMGLNRRHSECKSVSSASDCMLHKVTSLAILQTETSNKATGPVFDESKVAHISIAENCGVMNLPSKDPSGRSRLGFSSVIDEKGTIIQNPDLKHITVPAQEYIKR